jgi:hypothetical protein
MPMVGYLSSGSATALLKPATLELSRLADRKPIAKAIRSDDSQGSPKSAIGHSRPSQCYVPAIRSAGWTYEAARISRCAPRSDATWPLAARAAA